MATFWKGFAIFWIIFLVWYLTGGPQRVTNGNNSPVTTINSDGIGDIATSSNPQTQTDSVKSFSSQPKTNTINVTN